MAGRYRSGIETLAINTLLPKREVHALRGLARKEGTTIASVLEKGINLYFLQEYKENKERKNVKGGRMVKNIGCL